MLSGRLPFEAESAREVMIQHVTKEPVPLETVASSVPADLADVISLCLKKEPDDRMTDGRSLEAALEVRTEDEERIPQDLVDLVDGMKLLPWIVGGSLYASMDSGSGVTGRWPCSWP